MSSLSRLPQLIVLLSTVVTIAVNALANILPFNGQTSGQVSNKYFTAFTPAGYAFAIWSVIYTGLILFSVYQSRGVVLEPLRAIRKWVIISNVANAAWLPLFHYEYFGLSIGVIAVLLYALVQINLLLDSTPATTAGLWLARVPFGIYFGWVTVATVANVAVGLTAYQWSGWGLRPEHWSIIMLAVGILVASWVQARIRQYVPYLIVFVWAYWAIAEGQPDLLVQQTAKVGAFVAVALVVYRFVKQQNNTTQKQQ